jgi:hypothetical protein
LDSVNELLSEGFHIWISSRKNLKTKLEDRFNKVAMDIEEIEDEHQKFYIKKRLKEEYTHEQIENLISKIFNNFDIDNNRQISGKALHYNAKLPRQQRTTSKDDRRYKWICFHKNV